MSIAHAKNFWVLLLAGTLLAIPTIGVIYSPTLYRVFCSVTGYGGTVRRAVMPLSTTSQSDQMVTVAFDANVAPGLPWEFTPAQHSVKVKFGEPTKVYYRARNRSDQTMVARAVFNVTPDQAAPYFFKIQCFCFTNERLGPGESADMPLVFYVDEAMLKNDDAKTIRSITLSYTFFKQDHLSPEDIAAARDLSAGSKAKETLLKTAKTADYQNDSPRR